MSRAFYFPGILKKTSTAFMSLFKDILVAKNDASGNLIKYRTVPITFAHKQKFIARLLKNRSNGENFNMMLPHIGVNITGIKMNHDLARGGNLVPLYRYVDNNDISQKLYGTIPYTIDYNVSLISTGMTEMSMMLEQILPEFSPYKNITIKEFDFLPDFTRDLKVNLINTQPTFFTEITDDILPRVEFDMTFQIDAWIYRPMLVSQIIKSVKVELKDYVTDALQTTYNYVVIGDDSSSFTVSANEWTDEPGVM